MKFDEKLIILRKKLMLSQEGLAEKINVTRQTVSKWELGQTKPDMDKLTELSKLFNVSIDELTNDNTLLEENTEVEVKSNKKNNNKGNRKFILYILIIIFIASLVTLTYRIGCSIVDKKNEIKEQIRQEKEEQKIKQKAIEDKIKEEEEKIKKEQELQKQKREIESFNWHFDSSIGVKTKGSIDNLVDQGMKSNTQNKEHLVEFVFDGISHGTDPSSISSISGKLKTFNWNENDGFQKYEVAVNYDEIGYVNKVTITTK